MPRLQLREYQEEAIAAQFGYFATHTEGNPVIAMPTGSGKSVVIAEFIRRSLEAWPSCRFIVPTHSRELVEQDYDEFCKQWGSPLVPAGIYSAGLGQRDTRDRVIFASIQSIYTRARELGPFDLVLVDEAHMIPHRGEGRYRTYLDELRAIAPDVRVCGYTATPYRLSGGLLCEGEGAIFTEIAHEVPIERLVDAGHLVPLIAREVDNPIDVSEARVEHGDFKAADLEEAATRIGLVDMAVAEALEIIKKQGRRACLWFCVSRAHARQVCDAIRKHGIAPVLVLGDSVDRSAIVRGFREGEFPHLVSVGVLTTGFNAPRCDCLVMMRPTASTALYVQMMGRGMRSFPGKKDCLVLDYAENVARHGPINRVRPRRARGGPREPLTKACPTCRTIVLLGEAFCAQCGHQFLSGNGRRGPQHGSRAGSEAPYDTGRPKEMPVTWWRLQTHRKEGKPDSVRVDYQLGLRYASEWICPAHGGYAGTKAARWWKSRGGTFPPPSTAAELIDRQDEVTPPASVKVVPEGRYLNVVGHVDPKEQPRSSST